MKPWQTDSTWEAIDGLAQRLAAELSAYEPFVLWLEGPMGAGKTSLVGAVLRALGLPRGVPVTSPTFAYMNEYEIAGRTYAHLDLYRAEAGFDAGDLGLVGYRPFAGVFIEWPEQVGGDLTLRPTHVLTISYLDDESRRRYRLQPAAKEV